MLGIVHQFLERLWESNEVLAVIVAAVLSVTGWIIVRLFLPRGKIAWGVSHQHAFLLQKPQPGMVYTKQIWVQNIGRAPVQNIEMVFAAPPNHFDIWPQRHFTTAQNPNGNLIVGVDNLNPREYFTISMLQVGIDTPLVTNVRWNGGVGRQRQMAPQQVLPRWVQVTILGVLAFGVFSILYFLIRGLLVLF
jgi:hypothetical protein